MRNQQDLIGKVVLGYQVDEHIGSGGFGTVYKVSKSNESGKYVYALKHITIPTEVQYNSVLSSMGGDFSKADNYFKSELSNIVNEINILNSLSEMNSSHVVAYYDNDIVKQENPLRYDIYIRMEYLTSLSKYMMQNEMKVQDVINLGVEVLSALELAHANNIIHRDIKDDNIFINRDGKYKLGDFGIAKILKDSTKAASMKGTPAFIAPEVYSGKETYSNAVDLYSLGIVLYKLMNFYRLPFLPAYPEDYEMDDVDKAIGRRLTGEVPNLPANANNEFGQVIVRAISTKENRFRSAREFIDALNLVKSNLQCDELERVINKQIFEAKFQNNQNSNTMNNFNSRINDYETTAGADVFRNSAGNNILSGKYTTTNDEKKNKDLFLSVGAKKQDDPQGLSNIREPLSGVDNQRYNNPEEETKSEMGASRDTGKIEREHVAPVEKRDLNWLLYISPAIIGIVGIILFFAVVPSTVGKILPINAILTGDINKIINSIGTSSSSASLIFLRVLFYIIFVAFVTSLFFVGRQLQKKKEPNSPGAILRGKDAYFKILDISQRMSEVKRQMNNRDVNKIQEKIKRIEEQLKIETDFGCGNNLVTDCENNIADELNHLKRTVNEIVGGEEINKRLQNVDQVAFSLTFLLKKRRELTKR